jgi:putative SOS response-associated peptidase YedK
VTSHGLHFQGGNLFVTPVLVAARQACGKAAAARWGNAPRPAARWGPAGEMRGTDSDSDALGPGSATTPRFIAAAEKGRAVWPASGFLVGYEFMV